VRNYFEAERIIIPFNKVARVSKALDKNGKVYSVNVFLDGAESASFADAEAARFINEFKMWLEHMPNGALSSSFG